MADPIVALISSYKEDKLIQGTIRSIYSWVDEIVCLDGATEDEEIPGEETDFGIWEQPIFDKIHIDYGDLRGNSNINRAWWWDNEHEKRNLTLNIAHVLMGEKTFWILTIDADEILVWGEYLQDWINVLRPGYPQSQENVVPIKRTEAAWTDTGYYADIAPSRLIHSSLVKEYLVGCWKITTPDNKVFEAGHYQAPKGPMFGEPHIHHRHYLRREDRRSFRSGKHGEEARYTEGIRDLAESLPDLKIVEDAGKVDSE